tara:strand:+ start:479 stop:880 length:402 start_codon:yes stop_codon:yes gene_type:complete
MVNEPTAFIGEIPIHESQSPLILLVTETLYFQCRVVVFISLKINLKKECMMTMIAEQQMEHIGETKGCADHDHDMIHELSKRLDALWRCDQYIANAEGHADLRRFWKEIKTQEEANISRLKKLLSKHIQNNCF